MQRRLIQGKLLPAVMKIMIFSTDYYDGYIDGSIIPVLRE